jgi:hypothetical protein
LTIVARPRRFAALALASALLVACGSKGEPQPGFNEVPAENSNASASSTTAPLDATTTTVPTNLNLVGVCPNPVVIQLDTALDLWALPYVHLFGEGGSGSSTGFRAPLVNRDSTPTGIDIELRSVGRLPAGGVPAASVLGDPTVLFTTTDINTVVPVDATRPVIVAAPWARGDLALQWTATLPAMRTIADIAGTTLTNPDAAPDAAAYLRGSGLLPDPAKAGQVRRNVEGVPPGSTTSLTHLLTVPEQARALVTSDQPGPRAQLLADVGWEPYPHALVVNQASAAQRIDCIRSVVPLIQYSVLRLSLQPKRSVARLVQMGQRMGLTLDQNQLTAQITAALSLEMLATGNEASPIAADPALARLIQIARAQKAVAIGQGKTLKLPDDLPAELGPLVDRGFIDSDLKFTIRDKPDFGVDPEVG